MSHAYISLISCLLPLVISTDLLKLPLELIPTLVYGNLVGWDGIFKYPLIAKMLLSLLFMVAGMSFLISGGWLLFLFI